MLLLILYWFTRLVNINSLPIFNDEAFFIFAARQIIANPLANIFINFSDGKEPLFFWLYTLPVKFFPDALLGIRLLTVFLGFLTLVYLLKIAKKLSLNSWLVGLAFIFSPFLLFYQRIGMQETLLTFFLVGAGYYFLNKQKIWLGIFLGLALLTKTTALAFIIFLLPFVLHRRYFSTLLIMVVVYLPALLGLTQIIGHNSGYFGLISAGQMLTNFKETVHWWWEYQGPLGLLGIFFPPVILESLVAKIFFPRYFLFAVPFMILLAAKIFKKVPVVFILLLIPNIYLCGQILFNLEEAPLPSIERWQFLESWPAGYGIKETAEYLKSETAKTVVVEDIMIARYGLEYYYPQASYQTGGTGDYYVTIRQQDPLVGMTEVYTYRKPVGREKISVYQKL